MWAPNADTGQFAVESIRRRWHAVGGTAYPNATRVLITATRRSNGSRLRLWKTELASFAAETGLEITVLHLPPGRASGTGWNIGCSRDNDELARRPWSPTGPHRNHQRRHHQTGLKVHAVLDTNTYTRGIKIPTEDEGVRGPPPPPARLPRRLNTDHRQKQPRRDTPN